MTPIVRAAWVIGIVALLVVLALVVPPGWVDEIERWRIRGGAP